MSAGTPSAHSLTAQDLAVSLAGRAILSEVDCALHPGELLALLGPNGAGKTTLVRALAGLLPPAAGQVRLGGRDLAALGRHERARAIAYLPQGGTVAWPLPVKAVVALGRLPHGAEPDALAPGDHAAVARAMRATDIEALAERSVLALSGGERARVLLARALAVEAGVLLCDEPVATLDPQHQLAVMDVLKAEARQGRAVAVVMHDLALAARFADRIAILKGGRLVAQGAPREVLTRAGVAHAFAVEALVEERDDGLLVLPWRLPR
ncbi:ABC transporter ATP-binding protein [Chelatococcus sp. SYSU_G07232]|uniref:ABC transporter ATP-binding protein n=1 Tax=Chelatococcus albus TaxID=3047466 RepID=A0ABT7AI92_9HYPH|nr:ABC transporter ATP-binding protein [Chelatococcus sp. SYSU_G07232]MDJ1158800.1 ABC transporter ATP-binding protein [Chelatococcus sp. SYSU_G07232]